MEKLLLQLSLALSPLHVEQSLKLNRNVTCKECGRHIFPTWHGNDNDDEDYLHLRYTQVPAPSFQIVCYCGIVALGLLKSSFAAIADTLGFVQEGYAVILEATLSERNQPNYAQFKLVPAKSNHQ